MFLSNVRDYIVKHTCNHFNDFPCGIINVRLQVYRVPCACSVSSLHSRGRGKVHGKEKEKESIAVLHLQISRELADGSLSPQSFPLALGQAH